MFSTAYYVLSGLGSFLGITPQTKTFRERLAAIGYPLEAIADAVGYPYIFDVSDEFYATLNNDSSVTKPKTLIERLKAIGYPLDKVSEAIRYPFTLNLTNEFETFVIQTHPDSSTLLTSKKRLQLIGYDLFDVPDDLCDSIDQDIMTNPVKLDHDRDHDHYVDKAWLENYWKEYNANIAKEKLRKSEPAPTEFIKINPFTNLPIRLEPVLDEALKKRIEEYVASKEQAAKQAARQIEVLVLQQEALARQAARNMEAFVSAQEKIVANTAHQIDTLKEEVKYQTAPRSNLNRLRAIQFSPEKIPTQYMDAMTGDIMTYPVMLDKNPNHIVDLRALLTWWNQSEANKNKNPFTGKLLEHLELQKYLLESIDVFVDHQERTAYQPSEEDDITAQVALIKSHILQRDNEETPSSHERLRRKQFGYEKIPEWLKLDFIAQNFVAEVMTHPVKLDGKHVVDFNELQAWWNADPANMHKNFYTGQKLKSITYMEALKVRIDAFVGNPEEYLRASRTLSFQLPPLQLRSGIYTRTMFLANRQIFPLPHHHTDAAQEISAAADEAETQVRNTGRISQV